VVAAERDSAPKNPVLDTKFFMPRWRRGQVSRPRLVARLEHGAESKLTLISAPAGFGKTSLLAEWLASESLADRNIAWLSLDAGDSHPAVFWIHLITALQKVVPGVGASTITMLQSPQPPATSTLLPGFLNELSALSRELVLVLDDYHLIEAPEVHEDMTFVLDHLPPALHLVIATRADPSLPLARMRVRGDLVEIRAADLRFLSNEAAAYLNGVMALDLTDGDIALLEGRTEGWIAALQLAALSAQGREDVAGFIGSFAGDHRYMVDYLVEEVLERQPETVRNFLLQTSILDRLSGALCDAVTCASDGKGTLELLDRANLFVVPLDDRRQWYRYHHLFADVLQAHLTDWQPERVPELHLRASEWFERDGQPDRAIRHALAAGDFRRAACLMELEAERVMRNHQPEQLIGWLASIPDALIRAMPVLSTYYAMALQGMGDLEGSASYLDDAERWLDCPAEPAGTVVAPADLGRLESRIALARGYLTMAAGDLPRTNSLARRALELLPQDEHHWRGTAASLLALVHWANGDLEAALPLHTHALASFVGAGDSILALISAYNGAELQKARGRLDEARKSFQRGLELAARLGQPAMAGTANLHFGLSELWCEQGEIERASEELRLGGLAISSVPPSTPYRHLMARARLRRTQGDVAGALQLLDEAEPLYIRTPVFNVRPLAAWRARLWLAVGRIAEAAAWARAQNLSADSEPSYGREYEHLTFVRVLLAQYRRDGGDVERLRGADVLLLQLSGSAEAGGRTGAILEILILRAIVCAAMGDNAAAIPHIERALQLAEPQGYVRIFVDEGEPVRDLLRQAIAKGIGGPYARRLFGAFEPALAGARTPALAEDLTPREIEILRLVAAGMQNQAIADHLVISLPTVKRHIANTYGKLGVSHRTAAVARATELSLL
jgi:LuxR family maltose regulon positive regulatory protein